MQSTGIFKYDNNSSSDDLTLANARIEMLQQELMKRQAEIDSLRLLPKENKYLREKNLALNDRVEILTEKWTEPINGDVITLRARLLAYQKHCKNQDATIEHGEKNIVELREKVMELEEELRICKRRCGILYDRLRTTGGVTPITNNNNSNNTEEMMILDFNEDDPTSFLSLAHKLKSAESEREVLSERLVTLQEDYERRGFVMTAVQRENTALRASISKLINHIQVSKILQLNNNDIISEMKNSEEGNTQENMDETQRKLLTYQAKREAKKNVNIHGDSKEDG